MSTTRLRSLPVALALGLLLVLVSACSGTDDSPAGQAGDTTVTSTTTVPPTTVGDTSEPATTLGPPSPSVLPEPSTEPGAPPAASACALLRDAVPITDLLPRDNGQWVDERQRVIVDAGRDAAIFAQAAAEPEAPSAALEELADFSTFVAATARTADSAAAALSAIDAYPRSGEVGAASAEVARWQSVRCG